MLKNGKIILTIFKYSYRFAVFSSAYEVWGSPEMLTKEKIKRTKARQDEYEGKIKYTYLFSFTSFPFLLFKALFSLKKSVKEYQKRLSLLENASFDNRKSVNIISSSIFSKLCSFR